MRPKQAAGSRPSFSFSALAVARPRIAAGTSQAPATRAPRGVGAAAAGAPQTPARAAASKAARVGCNAGTPGWIVNGRNHPAALQPARRRRFHAEPRATPANGSGGPALRDLALGGVIGSWTALSAPH